MATRTTLNVSLPVELGRFVEKLVEDGHYATASEVIRAAVRLLKEREQDAALGRSERSAREKEPEEENTSVG